jgi:hypothetical protein
MQGWANTSCGFGGMAGQKLTDAQMVCISLSAPLRRNFHIYIYHGGRFAYRLFADTESGREFIEKCISKLNFPGLADMKRGLTGVKHDTPEI